MDERLETLEIQETLTPDEGCDQSEGVLEDALDGTPDTLETQEVLTPEEGCEQSEEGAEECQPDENSRYMDERLRALEEDKTLTPDERYERSKEVFEELRLQATGRYKEHLQRIEMPIEQMASRLNVPFYTLMNCIRPNLPFQLNNDILWRSCYDHFHVSCQSVLFGYETPCILPPIEAAYAARMEELSPTKIAKVYSVAKEIYGRAEAEDRLLSRYSSNFCLYHRLDILATERRIKHTELLGEDAKKKVRQLFRYWGNEYKETNSVKGIISPTTLMFFSWGLKEPVDYFICWDFVRYNEIAYYPIEMYSLDYDFDDLLPGDYPKDFSPEKKRRGRKKSIKVKEAFPLYEDLDFVDDRHLILTYHFNEQEAPRIISDWRIRDIIQWLMLTEGEDREAIENTISKEYMSLLIKNSKG